MSLHFNSIFEFSRNFRGEPRKAGARQTFLGFVVVEKQAPGHMLMVMVAFWGRIGESKRLMKPKTNHFKPLPLLSMALGIFYVIVELIVPFLCFLPPRFLFMRTGRDDRAMAARRRPGDISPQRLPRREAVGVLVQQAGLQPGERRERLLPQLQEYRRPESLQGLDAPVLSERASDRGWVFFPSFLPYFLLRLPYWLARTAE